MTSATDPAHHLVDRLEVLNTCTRMAWLADCRDWDGLLAVFDDERLADHRGRHDHRLGHRQPAHHDPRRGTCAMSTRHRPLDGLTADLTCGAVRGCWPMPAPATTALPSAPRL